MTDEETLRGAPCAYPWRGEASEVGSNRNELLVSRRDSTYDVLGR